MVCEKNTHAMTLAVVHEKIRHAMTPVDPCGVNENKTHAMTLGVVPDMVCDKNTHAMTLVDPCVVCDKTIDAIKLGGSMCGLFRITHMQGL